MGRPSTAPEIGGANPSYQRRAGNGYCRLRHSRVTASVSGFGDHSVLTGKNLPEWRSMPEGTYAWLSDWRLAVGKRHSEASDTGGLHPGGRQGPD
jgi:hypothetical protein